MRLARLVTASALLALAAGAAHAQTTQTTPSRPVGATVRPGPYLGLEEQWSSSRYPTVDGFGTQVSLPRGLGGTNLFLGGRVRNFGLEFGYGTSRTTNGVDGNTGLSTALALRHQVTLDAIGYLPITAKPLELIGLVGATHARARITVADGGNTELSSGYINGYHLGLGAQYTVAAHVGLRAIVQRERNSFEEEDNGKHRYNAWVYRLGFLYQF